MKVNQRQIMGLPLRASKRPFPWLLFSLLSILLALTLSIWRPAAQAAPDTITANGWTITPLIANGEEGFTTLSVGRVGDNGRTVVAGIRNGRTGIFIVQGSSVTEVASDSTILPGGLGSISFVSDFGVAPQGDVLFSANVAGGSLPAGSYAFRSSNGTITQQQPTASGFSHTPSQLTSDGRWLAQQSVGTFPNHTDTYQLTNGTTATPVFSFANSSAACVTHTASQTTPNTNGVVAYYDQTSTIPFVGGRCATELGITRDWAIKLDGAGTGTIASGTAVELGTLSGTEADFANLFYLNNQNQVAWLRRVYDGTFAFQQQVVVSSAQGEQVLLDSATTNASKNISLVDFDHEGRIVLIVLMDDFNTVALMGGPSLANDIIIQTGQTLFGQTVTSLGTGGSNVSNAPTGTFGDRRNILFTYSLQDGTSGIAIASKDVTRWTNSAGGSWGTASNWLPAIVPDAATETLFDLDASYDVTVGTRPSGRSSVAAGSVAFQSANLTLTGPFSVGGAASFTLPNGTMTASDLIIGHLPPTNPANPPTARVNISNDGTVFTAGAQTIVGQAGEGDLFISDGRLDSGEALLGSGSPGTAVVGGPKALWNITSLNVGAGYTATLTIENGGQVVVTNAAVIGQADALQPYPASIAVNNIGQPTPGLGNLRVNQLTVGDALPGLLDIQNGGVVAVFDLLQAGVQAHNQVLADGRIRLEGTDGIGSQGSALLAFKDVLLGVGDGARGDWQIFDGGNGSVIGDLHLGHEAGSRGTLSISGRSLDGLRSQLSVGTPNGVEMCWVGFAGRGTVTLFNGGLLTCRNMNIGGAAGSQGAVFITGLNVATPSTLKVTAALCVGGATICGSANAAAGTLTLQNGGQVETDALVVGSSGHLLGQGTVQAGFANIWGEVAPGVNIALPSSAPGVASLAVVSPGTLVISSSVALTETAVIALDIHALDSYDQLVIDGTAELAGQLILHFGEGFAPQQADVFNFIQTGGATGSFADVVITGLAPGFEYDLALTNGVVTLTALNDGVPTTQPSPADLFLPLVMR